MASLGSGFVRCFCSIRGCVSNVCITEADKTPLLPLIDFLDCIEFCFSLYNS